jgi:hypothetical protein
MALPPFDAGAVKLTVACAFPAAAVPMAGAPGTVVGVTLFEAADADPVPTELVAFTVNVYAVPLVRPVITCDSAVDPALLSTPPAGFEVTVYPVTALPPLEAGALKVTVAWALPAVAVPIVGAPGTVAGVTLFEAAEAAPVPAELVAVTVNV